MAATRPVQFVSGGGSRVEHRSSTELHSSIASIASRMGRRQSVQLSDGELRELGETAQVLHASPGTKLFSEGERVGFLALVESGEIELYRLASGRHVVYEILHRGDLVGAVPFLTRAPSAFSARALSPVTLVEIASNDLGTIHASRPAVARVVMLALAHRVDRVERRLGELIVPGLRSRVAALLLDETEAEEALIRLPQSTLAGLLGASRPRVNRILKEFEREGLVRLTYRRVEILDRERLHQIAA